MNMVRIGISSSVSGDGAYSIGGAYVRAVKRAGGLPLVLTPAAGIETLDAVDGIILSGGGDVEPERYGVTGYAPEIVGGVSRERDEFEFELAREAFARKMPLFGICRGVQVLNAALGGTLHLDIPNHRQTLPRPDASHTVTVTDGTRLSRITGGGTLSVNSFHHQGVKVPAPVLRVGALSEDGVIESVEASDRYCLGVQWHPECLDDPASCALFEALAEAAREWREETGTR